MLYLQYKDNLENQTNANITGFVNYADTILKKYADYFEETETKEKAIKRYNDYEIPRLDLLDVLITNKGTVGETEIKKINDKMMEFFEKKIREDPALKGETANKIKSAIDKGKQEIKKVFEEDEFKKRFAGVEDMGKYLALGESMIIEIFGEKTATDTSNIVINSYRDSMDNKDFAQMYFNIILIIMLNYIDIFKDSEQKIQKMFNEMYDTRKIPMVAYGIIYDYKFTPGTEPDKGEEEYKLFIVGINKRVPKESYARFLEKYQDKTDKKIIIDVQPKTQSFINNPNYRAYYISIVEQTDGLFEIKRVGDESKTIIHDRVKGANEYKKLVDTINTAKDKVLFNDFLKYKNTARPKSKPKPKPKPKPEPEKKLPTLEYKDSGKDKVTLTKSDESDPIILEIDKCYTYKPLEASAGITIIIKGFGGNDGEGNPTIINYNSKESGSKLSDPSIWSTDEYKLNVTESFWTEPINSITGPIECPKTSP